MGHVTSGCLKGWPVLFGRLTHDHGQGRKRVKAFSGLIKKTVTTGTSSRKTFDEQLLERRGYGVTSDDDATRVRRCASL